MNYALTLAIVLAQATIVVSAPLVKAQCDGDWCIDFYVAPTNNTGALVALNGTQRAGDPGWGVDIKIDGEVVRTSIWDTDGDGFFQMRLGDKYCKIDAGSEGLGPGAQMQVFEMNGLACHLRNTNATAGNSYVIEVTSEVTPMPRWSYRISVFRKTRTQTMAAVV